MDTFLAKLGRQMAELERACAPSAFAVAFSGGRDSSVLLAGCRRLDLGLPLRALHVDHGLQPDSRQWARHCAQAARDQGVEFRSVRVEIGGRSSHGLEAQAREHRYRALGELLGAGEMLLTAHHQDDQLETVLLRLFRGAGVKGLRGIVASGALGRGFLGRPLLAFSRAEISAAAQAWELQWLEDPSNRDLRFDRNYLRATVLPSIRRRWPAVARTVSRAAAQMADAEGVLDALADRDARGIDDPSRISLAALRALDAPRRRNLLRHLLRSLDLPLPSARQLEQLLGAVDVARPDARACVRWPGAEAHVYGDRLYLMAELAPPTTRRPAGRVRPGQPWSGPEGRIELVAAADGPALPDAWAREGLDVRFRAGGERLKLYGAAHHRPLKKLLQEARIVPWMRARMPLLYHDGQLVAVGELWISDRARAAPSAAPGWRVRWSGHPAPY